MTRSSTVTRDPTAGFESIERAVADMAAGKAVVVVDDEDRENEGDLIFGAQMATPELLSFMVRYTSGYVCVALTEDECDRLDLPPMHHTNSDSFRTAFTVTVDAKAGITTGISAFGPRAHDPVVGRPGVRARVTSSAPGTCCRCGLVRVGCCVVRVIPRAAVDLARLAGLAPAGALCKIVSQKNEGEMARMDELVVFAADHLNGSLITIADLIGYRRRFEKHVVRVAQARTPTAHRQFLAYGYDSLLDGIEHIAMVRGDVATPACSGEDVLVRVHWECLTGDVLGSLRCDCGPQLDAALAAVAAEGRGVVLYMRGHEGRGIGLLHKLQAYQLQEAGADTIDANLALGLPADARDYGTGAQILADLGVRSMRLLTNNPDKRAGLEGYGLRYRRAGPAAGDEPARENLRYLRTKRDRNGHDIPDLDEKRDEKGA